MELHAQLMEYYCIGLMESKSKPQNREHYFSIHIAHKELYNVYSEPPTNKLGKEEKYNFNRCLLKWVIVKRPNECVYIQEGHDSCLGPHDSWKQPVMALNV